MNRSKCIGKICPQGKICNPSTGRCKKPSRKRKSSVKTPRRNPVRLVRKIKSPMTQRDCSICLEPTFTRTFCTGGRRHPLCVDDYYRLLGVGIEFCPVCREKMNKKPGL